MEIIYFLLCFIQPIVLPTPEAVTILSGSAALGAFKAFIIGIIGTIAGIATMYLLSKKYGARLIKKFVKEEHLNKYKMYVQRNQLFFTGILFIVPILPDEVVCIGSGIIGISFTTFISIAILCKSITILTYAYSVEMAAVFNIHTFKLVLIEIIILVLIKIIEIIIKTIKANTMKT